jgi:rhodanese-related sulfurtransferase
VLGVLPGIIGALQGAETVKLMLGLGEPLIGRLLLFDALAMSFRELTLRKDPACPLCGERPSITQLIDYESFCGLRPAAGPGSPANPREITARELAALRARGEDVLVVDVREPFEYEIARIPDAVLIPLGSLPARVGELDQQREIVLCCHTGRRGERALEFLEQAGFRRLKNLQGGVDAWSRDVDPSVIRY